MLIKCWGWDLEHKKPSIKGSLYKVKGGELGMESILAQRSGLVYTVGCSQ